MRKNLSATAIAIWVICLCQHANATLPQFGGATASLKDFKVTCGSGQLPLAMEGNLKGVVNVPPGKVIFHGKHARFGYCGYPAPEAAPSLINTSERSTSKNTVSSITDQKGLNLSCANGQLPFALKGSADGTLNTSKGAVNLHGDHNEIAVCLVMAKSI